MQVASRLAGQQPPTAGLRRPAVTAPPTGGAAEFAELAELAARVCAAPVAMIINGARIEAGYGLAAAPWCEVDPVELAAFPPAPDPREVPGRPDVVADAPVDARHAGHPLVAGGPRIRFAARVPMPGGDPLGAVVVLGGVPALLTDLQRDTLRTIAGRAAGLIELDRSARSLALARERLAAMDGAADAFVALISHEMRTPLATVCGYLELLTDPTPLPPAQARRFHDAIDRNSRRLLRMVDDMMLLSRTGATGLAVSPGPVDLVPVTAAALAGVSARATGKGVRVDSELAGAAWLDGDATRLRQAVDHLLCNAVKFTPSGGRVDVRLIAGPPVTLHISDTGVGIPLDERPRLFDRFFRGSAAQEEEVSGAGLGLSVTKAILDAHGAAMTVTGRSGRGTAVTVTFGGTQ